MSRASFDTLPSEVKIRIFSRLPFCERVRLTRVSKTWRHFLLHWPGMFEKIENRCMCSFESNPQQLGYSVCDLPRALLPYAPYIKPTAFRELAIILLTDASVEQKNAELHSTFDLFIALRCYNIKKCFLSVENMDMGWFSKFLRVTSPNMTSLTMFYRLQERCSVPILDMILTHLPKLKELKFTVLRNPSVGNNFPLEIFAGVDPSIHMILPEHSMTDLELDCRGSALEMPLDDFIVKLTKLQYVTLNEDDYREPRRILEALNACPDLRMVIVNRHRSETSTPLRKPESEGLYHLELGFGFAKASRYCPMVSKHHKTLETLIIDGEVFKEEAMTMFASHDFPRLQKLILNDKTFRFPGNEVEDDENPDALADAFETFMHKLTPLQHLEIISRHVMTDRMLQALETVPCLRKLEMALCRGVSEQSLLRFLDNTRSKDCLEHIELLGIPCTSNQILHDIGRKLTALKHLVIANGTNISLFDGLDRFLDTSPIIGTLRFLSIACNKDDDFIPTDEQVDAVLNKLHSKVSGWHFYLATPNKQRARVRSYDWWYQNVYKPEHPDEDHQTGDSSTDDSSNSSVGSD